MHLPRHSILRALAWLSAAIAVAGCSSSDSRARAALGDYQTATAANDLPAARRALLELVLAKDDVAEYWVELGKVQAAMGSYNDAYYAFTRAYELNRSDPSLVRALTELALRSGDLTQARARAAELEIVSPGDPWVKLVEGWGAYSELHFDEALAISDSLLASTPFDPTATALKARALFSMHRENDAVDLLNKQIQAQPSDAASMALLAKIYEREDSWTKVAELAQRIVALSPTDQENSLLLIEAAFRSGQAELGRKASFRLLQPGAEAATVTKVLELWREYWPSPQRIADGRRLAAATAGLKQRLAYAEFLTRSGDPADAIGVASSAAGLPVRAETAEANAVLADALSRSGNLAAAKVRFDAVLAFDPGNAMALRGRSELALRTGNAAAAVVDAQKLVTVLPDSADSRLLLARSFLAAGDRPWMERTLWSAFQDIPGDEHIFAALQSTRKGDRDAVEELNAEFARQRDNQLNRGML
jgi:tetratricopeptide (TPR) repeat protein